MCSSSPSRRWEPAEPFDHKKRAHTALVHKKIFSRPYAVFTAIRIAVYNFTFFTVSTAIQRFSTAKCTLFHGQILFSRPYLDSKAKLFFRSHLAKRPLASFFAIKRPPRKPLERAHGVAPVHTGRGQVGHPVRPLLLGGFGGAGQGRPTNGIGRGGHTWHGRKGPAQVHARKGQRTRRAARCYRMQPGHRWKRWWQRHPSRLLRATRRPRHPRRHAFGGRTDRAGLRRRHGLRTCVRERAR